MLSLFAQSHTRLPLSDRLIVADASLTTVDAFAKAVVGATTPRDAICVCQLSRSLDGFPDASFGAYFVEPFPSALATPSLEALFRLCQIAGNWLRANASHVLVVHDPVLTSRAVTVAAAYLIWSGLFDNWGTENAGLLAAHYVSRWARRGHALSASQARYLQYLSEVLALGCTPNPNPRLKVVHAFISDNPYLTDSFQCYLQFLSLSSNSDDDDDDDRLLFSKSLLEGLADAGMMGTVVPVHVDCPLEGDVVLQLTATAGGERRPLVQFAFHTAFLHTGMLRLYLGNLDVFTPAGAAPLPDSFFIDLIIGDDADALADPGAASEYTESLDAHWHDLVHRAPVRGMRESMLRKNAVKENHKKHMRLILAEIRDYVWPHTGRPLRTDDDDDGDDNPSRGLVSVRERDVEQLTGMGFSKDRATAALADRSGQIYEAARYLLDQGIRQRAVNDAAIRDVDDFVDQVTQSKPEFLVHCHGSYISHTSSSASPGADNRARRTSSNTFTPPARRTSASPQRRAPGGAAQTQSQAQAHGQPPSPHNHSHSQSQPQQGQGQHEQRQPLSPNATDQAQPTLDATQPVSSAGSNGGGAFHEYEHHYVEGVPPPPPPPMANGMPPPPPPPPGMGGGGRERSTSSGVQPSVPMKKLHWSVVPASKLSDTVWAQTATESASLQDLGVDPKELEELFGQAQLGAGGKGGSGSGGSGGDGGAEKKKGCLIDLQRANNVGIVLSRLKMPRERIAQAIASADGEAMSVDSLKVLMRLLPTADELSLLRNFKGPVEELNEVERFFLAMGEVPRASEKIQGLLYRLQFDAQVQELRQGYRAAIASCEELRASEMLREILQAILTLGNFLNSGTYRGGAQGFRLDILKKLSDTRAANSQMTLMHYLASVIKRSHVELFGFEDEVPSLRKMVRTSIQGHGVEVEALRKGLDALVRETEASAGEAFGERMGAFAQQAKQSFASLAAEQRRLTACFEVTLGYFGEEADEYSIDEFFQLWNEFRDKLAAARKDNDRKEEQKNRRKKVMLAKATGAKSSSSPGRE